METVEEEENILSESPKKKQLSVSYQTIGWASPLAFSCCMSFIEILAKPISVRKQVIGVVRLLFVISGQIVFEYKMHVSFRKILILGYKNEK